MKPTVSKMLMLTIAAMIAFVMARGQPTPIVRPINGQVTIDIGVGSGTLNADAGTVTVTNMNLAPGQSTAFLLTNNRCVSNATPIATGSSNFAVLSVGAPSGGTCIFSMKNFDTMTSVGGTVRVYFYIIAP